RHHRARLRHAALDPAGLARGARHDGVSYGDPCARAKRERAGGAHDAGARAGLGPARALATGHGARVPVRRRPVRAAHADEWRADGDPRRGTRAIRRVAQVRPAAVPRAPRAGNGGRHRGDRHGAEIGVRVVEREVSPPTPSPTTPTQTQTYFLQRIPPSHTQLASLLALISTPSRTLAPSRTCLQVFSCRPTKSIRRTLNGQCAAPARAAQISRDRSC